MPASSRAGRHRARQPHRACASHAPPCASHATPSTRRTRSAPALLAVAALAALPAARAQQRPADPAAAREVLVTAPAQPPATTRVTEDIEAAPASVTVVTKKDIDRKPVDTYGDLFRDVAGVNVVEYHQGLIAYGITLRGYTAGEHGRDVAVYLDGMPLNVTGSQHTNGYMDLAQLIPELVNRAEIVRGPFSVLAGNHAVGGSIQLYTDAAPLSGIKASVDNFGRVRVLPIANVKVGAGNLVGALDATQGPGYSRQSDLRRLNLFTRYTVPVGDGEMAFRVQLYDADADAAGYLDRAKLESGRIGPRDFLARGLGDAKAQQNAVFNYRSNDAEGVSGWRGGWFAVAYANNDLRKRWTDFDLSLLVGSSVPINQERDHLHQYGFDIRKTTSFATAGMPSQLLAGVQFNDERIDALRFRADADRRPLAPTSAVPDVIGVDRRVRTETRAVYAQYQLQPVRALKLTAGLRYDRLAFDTRLRPDDDTYAAALAAGAPVAVRSSASQFSPKLGAALVLHEDARSSTSLFANAARGLKSPYAFSDYYANVGVAAVAPSLSISSVRSLEAGLQGGATDGAWRWRASVWNTRQDREADRNAAGFYQSFKSTDRKGFDLEGSATLARATRVFANYSHVTARIREPLTPGADRVPNVPSYLFTVGASSVIGFGAHRIELWLADSLVGPQAVTADGSVNSRSFQRYSARAAYSHADWRGASVFLTAVGYSRQFDELVIDFGGGVLGTPVAPKVRVTAGVQVPL